MIRRSILSAALLLTAACATTPAMNSSTSEAKLQPTDYVLLSAPSQIQTLDLSTSTGVWGLHVNGTMTNRGFYPIGKVEGHGDLCADGKDWLSLSDLRVHKASEGGSPAAPYLLGCATGTGFKP